jgi:hypothetical protein
LRLFADAVLEGIFSVIFPDPLSLTKMLNFVAGSLDLNRLRE